MAPRGPIRVRVNVRVRVGFKVGVRDRDRERSSDSNSDKDPNRVRASVAGKLRAPPWLPRWRPTPVSTRSIECLEAVR